MLSVDDFHESYSFNDWSIQYVPLKIILRHTPTPLKRIFGKKHETQEPIWYVSSQKNVYQKKDMQWYITYSADNIRRYEDTNLRRFRTPTTFSKGKSKTVTNRFLSSRFGRVILTVMLFVFSHPNEMGSKIYLYYNLLWWHKAQYTEGIACGSSRHCADGNVTKRKNLLS